MSCARAKLSNTAGHIVIELTIPLAPRTARAIDLAIRERIEGPLFVTADGRLLDRHGAARIVARVTRRAGIAKHISPHTLRHAAMALVAAGVDTAVFALWLGHESTRTTDIYQNSRELHQPGEKPQVSSSQDRRNGVPIALMPAL